jgi:hypothetical protein
MNTIAIRAASIDAFGAGVCLAPSSPFLTA